MQHSFILKIAPKVLHKLMGAFDIYNIDKVIEKSIALSTAVSNIDIPDGILHIANKDGEIICNIDLKN